MTRTYLVPARTSEKVTSIRLPIAATATGACALADMDDANSDCGNIIVVAGSRNAAKTRGAGAL